MKAVIGQTHNYELNGIFVNTMKEINLYLKPLMVFYSCNTFECTDMSAIIPGVVVRRLFARCRNRVANILSGERSCCRSLRGTYKVRTCLC